MSLGRDTQGSVARSQVDHPRYWALTPQNAARQAARAARGKRRLPPPTLVDEDGRLYRCITGEWRARDPDPLPATFYPPALALDYTLPRAAARTTQKRPGHLVDVHQGARGGTVVLKLKPRRTPRPTQVVHVFLARVLDYGPITRPTQSNARIYVTDPGDEFLKQLLPRPRVTSKGSSV